ncbi:MAG: hypothetical protein OEQ39_25795 [Gammaproteobacteria bacterium]|nr:hypothetical protein [Gammaproteobacteria bacterium]MDH3465359.1 hypothetical protein [Gammaproteobacteria bacterium]
MRKILPVNRRVWTILAILIALIGGGTGARVLTTQTGVCGIGIAADAADAERLRRFAEGLPLQYVDAFSNVVSYIHIHGRLPECYLTKREAQRQGWSPGTRLWNVAPGTAIGGNRFGNREQRLPRQYNNRYVEADLDYDGRKRGAKRLVFVEGAPGKWLIWVTVDHYQSFRKVPAP